MPTAHLSEPAISATDTMRRRSSQRSYERRPIDDSLRLELERASQTLPALPFGGSPRITLIAGREGDFESLEGLGTYGMIKNAPAFLVGATQRGLEGAVDLGFALQSVVLDATRLGLGTCWLGGTFTKSRFARAVNVTPQEDVPAVVVVGYATAQRGRLDRIVRWGAGSAKRKPFEQLFFQGQYGNPLAAADAGPFAEALEMVRIGPSSSNTQPWRVVLDDEGRFHFYIERPASRRLAIKVGASDWAGLDIGIALCHFELAAAERGLKGRWEHLPDAGKSVPSSATYVRSFVPA